MNGVRVAFEALKREGVRFVFGIPGQDILNFYDALLDVPEIKHVLFRHDEGAIFAASACSRVLGFKPVVVADTAGSGVARLVNGISGAYYDCWPIIAISGPLDDPSQSEVLRPITKWCVRITDPKRIPEAIKEAVRRATTCPPGPVFIELPQKVQSVELEMKEYTPSVRHRISGNPTDIKKAAELLLKAEWPVILAGGAAIISSATSELTELAELIVAPVLTTITGRCAMSDDNPLFAGLGGFPYGMLGSTKAIKLLGKADVVLAVGVRFTELTTSQYTDPGDVKLIHINIDPTEIGKNYPVAVGILGDARLVLRDLIRLLKQRISKGDQRRKSRLEEVVKIQRDYEAEISPILNSEDVPIHPARAIKEIRAAFSKEAIATGEAGHVGNFSAVYFNVYNLHGFIRMGWFSSMGFALPAAIGAKLAAPDRQVVAICGDGGFLMNCQEVETARRENLGIVACIFNNGILGAIKLTQLAAFGRDIGNTFTNPDFVKLAEAFGCYGVRAEKPSELQPALQSAIKAAKEGVPAIVDIAVKASKPPRTGRWFYPGFHEDSVRYGYIYTKKKEEVRPPQVPIPT